MKLRVERLRLLQQPIDQFLRAADGQRGNVVDRLLRIELAALTARMLQRIDDVRADAEQSELEDLKQTAGSRADDDDVGLNRAVDDRPLPLGLSLKNCLLREVRVDRRAQATCAARGFYTRRR